MESEIKFKDDAGCNYPGCKLNHTESWAGVPLCMGHKEIIHTEAIMYYGSRHISRGEESRPHYSKIRHLTIFNKVKEWNGG